MFKYKSHYKINNDRAAKRKKGEIDKIHSYSSASDAELFSPPVAHAEGLMFKPLNDFIDHDKQK